MGRIALVTGASSGIGQATCQLLLANGYSVVGIARDFSKGPQKSPKFTPWSLDLADLNQVPQRLKDLAAQHPGIDALVLCAGRGHFGHLEQFSPTQIRQLIDLDLTAQILCVRAFLPHLKQKGRGDIIFLGSEAALQGQRQGAVYCAAKFALRGFVQALRQECAAAGIRVGIVNPGMVLTPFFATLDFAPGPDADHHILPGDVAHAIATMLEARPGTVLDEINLSPQKKVIDFKKKKK